MRLRDLLKFDFYFADSAAFRQNIADEMAWHEDWEAHVAGGAAEIDAMLYAKRPLMSDAMLRVFFEAYEIVADVLRDAPAEIGEKELTQLALGVGKPVRRARSGAQQRAGVDVVVRDRAPSRRRPGSAQARARIWPSAESRFAANCGPSCRISTTSRRSRATSSSPARSRRAVRTAR